MKIMINFTIILTQNFEIAKIKALEKEASKTVHRI